MTQLKLLLNPRVLRLFYIFCSMRSDAAHFYISHHVFHLVWHSVTLRPPYDRTKR